LGGQREEVGREIENLARKLTYLENNFATYHELDAKCIELSEKLVSLENRFRNQLVSLEYNPASG
jgi:hypothetical protein